MLRLGLRTLPKRSLASAAGCRRHISSSAPLKITPEVQDALKSNKPVVSLESTILTHGLPYPQNLQMAKEVEDVIRENGAIPATTAFIHGSPMVGLNDENLEYLCNTPDLFKVSRRDVPYVVSRKLSGGTTIAGTMILSHLAGIKVFATGGLGGVHRGAEITMDVSADLEELGQTPVGVVCSGPKSILDIAKTMEYLETKGVHVTTMGPQGTNIPGFFTRDSGVPSPYNFQAPEEAAELLYATESMKLNNGTVFCVPAPEEHSMPADYINAIIENAVVEAEKQGIKGKAVTPFLLKKVWEATKGNSVATNAAFVKNNAAVAARIANHLASLKGVTSYYPGVTLPSSTKKPAPTNPAITEKPAHTNPAITPASTIVVGTLALDMTCNLEGTGDALLNTSTPGKVETSVGGVGHNVALAASYAGPSTRLVSEVGPDCEQVLAELASNGFDTTGIRIAKDKQTARYIAMHDSKGQLVVACADMNAAGSMNTDFIKTQIKAARPKCVFFDGNIKAKQKAAAIEAARSVGAIIGFEPASVPKAAWLAEVPQQAFPHHAVDVCTPNIYELNSLFEAYTAKGLFDTDNWFPVIDALGVDQAFRNALENMSQTVPALSKMYASGVAQQAIHLLPYIPCLFIKDGARGVLSFQLVDDVTAIKQTIPANLTTGSGKPVTTRLSTGKNNVGVLVQHFPAELIDDSLIVSVTGAGDTFCGVLASEIAEDRSWLNDAGVRRTQVIDRAQRSAALTIQSELAVNPKIKELN
ncbi:hypothetical protein TRVA0_034S00518 [Trichomonascus vanleenenianus]|uniref:pseudouridine-5'-phosphate glycosidase/carbohydrate kinase family protein n=1 Tax=Trichomonascus vanleenenianus TaxID=2268995 RepID=UPI003ECB2D3B